MLDLTVLIITKNEEDNIVKCINSIKKIAKRVVVVDSGSSDKTVELSKSLGAEVYYHEFKNHASQINWGLNNTDINTRWVFRLDADEEITKELSDELEEKLPNIKESISGIRLRRRMYFMGKWIKHGGIYPTVMLRIFRNGKAICEQRIMDEHFVLTDNGEEITLNKDFIDKNTKPVTWWVDKHNWYSTLEMKAYIDDMNRSATDGVKPRLLGTRVERKRWFKMKLYYKTPLMIRAHAYFIYRYFIRLGFLDGKEGMAYHFLQGYWYRFLVDTKIYERNKEENK